MTKNNDPEWTLSLARELYNIPVWGETYFDVNEKGNLIAKLSDSMTIDLIDVSRKLREQGLSQPVLVRFPQLLRARVKELCDAFNHAIDSHQSHIKHVPFYPIKVNQQHTVVETILSCTDQNIGLEVGSKTELLAALGMLDTTGGMLICNGYKDRTYIRIALYAQIMGIKVYLVVENMSELFVIKEESQNLKITPNLGVRIRLNSVAKGNWQNSGGKHAKFGLCAADLLELMNTLKLWGCQDWLRMVHFHMGSQISILENYITGLKEALRIYAECHSHGCTPNIIDVGGGLGVDYSSMSDQSFFSMSYNMRDYAFAIIEVIHEFCELNQLEEPIVFTENGRAITAHHAMLMTNVLEVDSHIEKCPNEQKVKNSLIQLTNLMPQLNVSDYEKSITQYEIDGFQSHLNERFVAGQISLEQRAVAEKLIDNLQLGSDHYSLAKGDHGERSADKYYCNFSIFQSIPDVWGLKQIFPIMPLARLHERPDRVGRLHDLTCDSDGQIDEYAVNGGLQDFIPLHEIDSGQEYLLGFFLVGAYQEVLGDIHNLFGDTHAVNVEINQDGELAFSEIEVGDCVDELLSSLHLDGEQIITNCTARLNNTAILENDSNGIINEINDALFGYTYLDSIDRNAHRIKR